MLKMLCKNVSHYHLILIIMRTIIIIRVFANEYCKCLEKSNEEHKQERTRKFFFEKA